MHREAETSPNFRQQVAEIDSLADTHRLGRFKIAGYVSGNANLNLVENLQFPEIGHYDSTDLVVPTFSQVLLLSMKDAPLPLRWLEIRASLGQKGRVNLDWLTTDEVNHHTFEIERKQEKGSYQVVGHVDKGTKKDEGNQYVFEDQLPRLGKYTYRLRQVDIDGDFSYSSEVEVRWLEAKMNLLLYPNPADKVLHIRFTYPLKDGYKVALTNIYGLEMSIEGIKEERNGLQIGLNELAPGSYFLQVVDADGKRYWGRFQLVR